MGADFASEQNATMIQLIDEHAWEAAEVEPIGRAVTIEEWLAKMREWDMELSIPPISRISGGPYNDGQVIQADGPRGRLYFAAPRSVTAALSNGTPEDSCTEG